MGLIIGGILIIAGIFTLLAFQVPAVASGQTLRFSMEWVPSLESRLRAVDPDSFYTLAAAVLIAALISTIDSGLNSFSTVFTLEVDHETAERLVFAQNAGQLYYTLNPKDEFEEVLTRGVTIENLFEGDLVEDIFGN